MTILLTFFGIALAGLIWTLAFKLHEVRTGGRHMLPASWYAHDERLQARMSAAVLSLSEVLGGLWGEIAWSFRRLGVWAYRSVLAFVHSIERKVNREHDLSKNGDASPYIREMAEHKTLIRNGTDEVKPKHPDSKSEL